ncbi:MAG: carboxylating nicotinate-nucleotide diphosphorylase [Nitriliruptorales bacterium]|nr:carboxylating nicotinate-nucleotide diphosphorylase [Nitriliruptorales bacterium]
MTSVDPVTQHLIALALSEDLPGVDVTATATVSPDATATAAFVMRAPGVIAGLGTVGAVVSAVDDTLRFTALSADGDRREPGTTVATVTGAARSILAAERTALNLLTHLSGIATQTARFVDAVAGTACAIRDTRKTLPGMRALQKAAVAAGGGTNHRFSLSDGLLVKDNHVAVAGGITSAARRALTAAGGLPVQIEVDDLTQLDEALTAGARSVLLDNFTLDDVRAAVQRCRAGDEHVFVEASGNVNLETVRAIAQTGVDAVAVGALTHSVRALDIALDWEEE